MFLYDNAARLVATIVYISLIIFDSIKCFYSLVNKYARASEASERSRNAYFHAAKI